MFRNNNEKRDWTVLCRQYKFTFVWSLARLPATKPTIYYPGQKRTMLLMHKFRIEESECMIQLRNGERTQLATAATSCIVAKSDCRFFDITWCITKMVLFLSRAVHVQNMFVQPSEFEHLSRFQSWGYKQQLLFTGLIKIPDKGWHIHPVFVECVYETKATFSCKNSELNYSHHTNDIHITTAIPVPYKKKSQGDKRS